MKRKLVQSLLSLTVCLSLLLFALSGCSKAPEYTEIEERFRSLVEASYEINEIFFGKGLPTYERVYDPWEDMSVYQETDADGTVRRYIYYCYMSSDTYGDILAYRTGYTQPAVYLQILQEADTSREAVFSDEAKGLYYYACDYTPPKADFYYSDADPIDYDYVHPDSPYGSTEEIKALAETVFSEDYLSSVYSSMFDGVYSAEDQYVEGLSPRYYEYIDEDGVTYFMKSNTYQSFNVAKNVFDFSTAKIVKPSNAKKVTIAIEFYPENDPSARDEMKITMVFENGQWMLDSTTY